VGEKSEAITPLDQAASGQGVADNRKVLESPLALLLEHPTTGDIDPRRVRSAFHESSVWVLGFPEEPSQPGSADLLHFVIDDDAGDEKVMLAAFTSRDALRQALILNKNWRDQTVLEVLGAELLANLDPDVTVVLDPWTTLEYRLPLATTTR